MSQHQQYLDLKTIPKFEFQLSDQELINCIRELYVQTKAGEKKLSTHSQELLQKLSKTQFIDSLKLLSAQLVLPSQFQGLIKSNNHNISSDNGKIPESQVFQAAVETAKKLSQFGEAFSFLYKKIGTMQEKIKQNQIRISRSFRDKTNILEQQLTQFVTESRNSQNRLEKWVQSQILEAENRRKDTETKTLWKIKQCCKRLQERPTLEILQNSLKEFKESKTEVISSKESMGRDTKSAVDLESRIIKIQKVQFHIKSELESQVKKVLEQLENKYVPFERFQNENFQLNKKIENLYTVQNEHSRKHQFVEVTVRENQKNLLEIISDTDAVQGQVGKLTKQIQKLSVSDQFMKIMEKINPHELCQLHDSVKFLEQTDQRLSKRIQMLGSNIDAVRSKNQFWNCMKNNPQKTQQQDISHEFIQKLIRTELGSSELKRKMNNFQQKILELYSLKQGVNELLKKVGKSGREQEIVSLRYQIKRVEEGYRKEDLLQSNRLSILESTLENMRSSRVKAKSVNNQTSETKLSSSISYKKLLPVSCLSCQPQKLNFERRTVFKSKIVDM